MASRSIIIQIKSKEETANSVAHFEGGAANAGEQY